MGRFEMNSRGLAVMKGFFIMIAMKGMTGFLAHMVMANKSKDLRMS
jgi:hypothetical protein